jgi:hypothetical protein
MLKPALEAMSKAITGPAIVQAMKSPDMLQALGRSPTVEEGRKERLSCPASDASCPDNSRLTA